MNKLASLLTRVGALMASPFAFLIVLVYALLWAIFERDKLDWHGVATLATWMMTLMIQRSEHRDTQAIHAKLDHLLKVSNEADPSLTKIDEKEPEDVERYREREK